MKIDFKKEHWTGIDYQEYINDLKSLSDELYRDFSKKLTPTKYEMLGIRVPIMRKIANSISKGNAKEFLSLVQNRYYEETSIEGYVIANLKEESEFFPYFEQFILKIDNWAICDGFCNSLKYLKHEKHFPYFLNLLNSEHEFVIRVGLITILSWYIKEDYLNAIFKKIDEIKLDTYYVNMGASWLLAEMFTKYPKETEAYFQKNNLNDFTMNKTISKIRDSYRITKEEKDRLLKYKRKGNKK